MVYASFLANIVLINTVLCEPSDRVVVTVCFLITTRSVNLQNIQFQQ